MYGHVHCCHGILLQSILCTALSGPPTLVPLYQISGARSLDEPKRDERPFLTIRSVKYPLSCLFLLLRCFIAAELWYKLYLIIKLNAINWGANISSTGLALHGCPYSLSNGNYSAVSLVITTNCSCTPSLPPSGAHYSSLVTGMPSRARTMSCDLFFLYSSPALLKNSAWMKRGTYLEH